MWARLRKQIAVEREQLAHLLQVHEPLLVKCTTTAPDAIELSALAAMLHSFYTGSENIFKRIVVELGEPLPSGASWHRDLLEAMSVPSAVRPAAISVALRDRLGEYLNCWCWTVKRCSANWRPNWTSFCKQENSKDHTHSFAGSWFQCMAKPAPHGRLSVCARLDH